MNKNKAVSLIETLISMSIIALVAIAAMPIFTVRMSGLETDKYWQTIGTNIYFDGNVSIGDAANKDRRLFLSNPSNSPIPTLIIQQTPQTDGEGNSILPKDACIDLNGELTCVNTNLLNVTTPTVSVPGLRFLIAQNDFNLKRGVFIGFDNKTETTGSYITKTGVAIGIGSMSGDLSDNTITQAYSNAIAIGTNAMRKSSLTDSIAIGNYALQNVMGENNIAILNLTASQGSAQSTSLQQDVKNKLFIGYDSNQVTDYKTSTSADNGFILHGDQPTSTTSGYLKVSNLYTLDLGVYTIAEDKATGACVLTSDKRLKDILKNYNVGLKEIKKLNPVSFTYKTDPTRQERIGLIAQEVKKVIPRAVSQNKKTGYYAVIQEPILFALSNAIKDLNKENQQLENNYKKLEQKKIILEKLIAEQNKKKVK